MHMIKVVNFTLSPFTSISIFTAITEIKALLQYYDNTLAYDSEGSGFFPTAGHLTFAQIGFPEAQYIILPQDLIEFKSILEKSTMIMQNAKHDLKFLYEYKIRPKTIKDTFLQELILNAGKSQLKLAYKEAGLASLLKKYCGQETDKSIRKNITLSQKAIEYGAKDVAYLHEINSKQWEQIVKLKLKAAVDLDNEFVKCLAYAEKNGFGFDQEGWKDNYQKNIEKHEQYSQELFELIKNDHRVEEFIIIKSDLFTTPKECLDLNIESSQEMIPFFVKLGVNLDYKGKETTDAKVLKKSEEAIVKKYLQIKKVNKSISTYGLSFIEEAN